MCKYFYYLRVVIDLQAIVSSFNVPINTPWIAEPFDPASTPPPTIDFPGSEMWPREAFSVSAGQCRFVTTNTYTFQDNLVFNIEAAFRQYTASVILMVECYEFLTIKFYDGLRLDFRKLGPPVKTLHKYVCQSQCLYAV